MKCYTFEWCLSSCKRYIFVLLCEDPRYPPMLPFVCMTRWQGTMIGNGLLANAVPIARDDWGFPIDWPINWYVVVWPYGICKTSFSTNLWNLEQFRRSRSYKNCFRDSWRYSSICLMTICVSGLMLICLSLNLSFRIVINESWVMILGS